jgi:hypothetical protein
MRPALLCLAWGVSLCAQELPPLPPPPPPAIITVPIRCERVTADWVGTNTVLFLEFATCPPLPCVIERTADFKTWVPLAIWRDKPPTLTIWYMVPPWVDKAFFRFRSYPQKRASSDRGAD